MKRFDTIIIGLGGMGAAAAWVCSKRGQRVLGVEQFQLVHQHGSSHGQSRIIREAYYEHPRYVPLVRRAFGLWEDLEQAQGKNLLTRCPCANIGFPDSEIIKGVLRAAKEHQLNVDTWNAKQIRMAVPALKVPDNFVAVVEAKAGWLRVEQCVQCMLDQAAANQANLHENERVIDWKADSTHVKVTTTRDTYYAEHLIITAGPWAGELLNELKLPLTVMRQLQFWFIPPDDLYSMNHLPIFMLDTPQGHFYGIPCDAGPGVKVAQHYGASEMQSPAEIDRQITVNDEQPVRQFLQTHFPTLANAPLADCAPCIYTLTPDRHFIVDQHPEYHRVAIAAGFSGHGFKFAPVIGEMLADVLDDRANTEMNELFGIQRFKK